MKALKISALLLVATLLLGLAAAYGGLAALRWYYGPELPDVSSVNEFPLQVPLKVYSRDGKLIGEFGAERRAPLAYSQLPDVVVAAFLAAEDDRFFEHPGVDWQGLLRAGIELLRSGQKSQGGSTITMQLARNLFLTPERSYQRKIKEILLALEIEKRLSKQQILESYLNRIFLGQRAYGVGAAAQVYFGEDVAHLSWAQAALLAGLPKAPSRDNPVTSPERARGRRDYVLRRLFDLGRIDEAQYQQALAEPIIVPPLVVNIDTDARYVAEMVRADLVERLGEEAYSRGLTVVTHIDSGLQAAANLALRNALHEYDERHGWRGAEARLPEGASPDDGLAVAALFAGLPAAGELQPALVLEMNAQGMRLRTPAGDLQLLPDAYAWARFTERVRPAVGEVVRLRQMGEVLRLAQLPQAQGAFVALDPRDGGIVALAGGYDFRLNKFNRVTQALRQPGSGFKPILYAAAFDFGFTPASVVLDAPVVVEDSALDTAWRPQNYGGDLKGPMRLREALVQSRNLVSIRLLQAVGVAHARNYATRFGLPIERIPDNLTMALGTGVFTPLEMARAYAVFANGGHLIDPWFIETVREPSGKSLFEAAPRRVCAGCLPPGPLPLADAAVPATPPAPAELLPGVAPQVIDAGVAWMVGDILRDVVRRGTATRAKVLQRSDLAGKTGTTNDETDAWFYGYTPALVGVAWVGFDQPEPLGRGEVGGRAALPMWVEFMKSALVDVPQLDSPLPPGLVQVRVNPGSGQLASPGEPGAIFEAVPAARVPAADTQTAPASQGQLQELF